MSVSFIDGPADGHALELLRVPRLLRVTIVIEIQYSLDGKAPEGAVDALDQLDDRAEPGETVHVYERVTSPTTVHVHGRYRSWWAMSARYRWRDDVDAIALGLADNLTWRSWARAARLQFAESAS